MTYPASHYEHQGESPLEIARRRYAAGELTREAFNELKADLATSDEKSPRRPSLLRSLGGWPFFAMAAMAVLLIGAGSLLLFSGHLGGHDDWPWTSRNGGQGMGPGMMRGGGFYSAPTTPTVGSQAEDVAIRNFLYAPANLQIPVGGRVTFTNYDDAPHTATATDKSWDTGILNKGEKKTLTFDKPGTYTYYCAVHPYMQAVLTVR